MPTLCLAQLEGFSVGQRSQENIERYDRGEASLAPLPLTNLWELLQSLRSRNEYLFNKAISFAAALGARTPFVTMSLFSSFLP